MDTESRIDSHLAEAMGGLRDTQPEDDLWPGIARKLTPRHPRGTLLIRWPTALAAGLVIVTTTAAGTAILLHRAPAADSTAVAAVAAGQTSTIVTASFAPGDAALARAINDLEEAVRASLTHLDPDARTSVHQSLTALDAAIAQAVARQSAAPGDPGAARYLTSTLRKKLQLLRTVSQLTEQS